MTRPPAASFRVRSIVCALILQAAFAAFVHAQDTAARSSVPAESLQDLFRQANQAYDAGQFEKARDLYTRILAAVPANATAEYNLGNACARLHDVARAVIHYERALRSDPRLADARANLLQIAPPTNFPEVSPLLAPFRWIQQRMNINEWLWITFAFLVAACGGGALWALEVKPARLWRHLALLLTVLFLVCAGFSTAKISDTAAPTGIVLSDKILARSGPGENYLEAMELPAGAKVHAAGSPQRGWIKIRTPEGRTAYLPSGDVEWI